MPDRLPPFIAIEAFIVTGSVSSLTAASKILHVTPSAISRRIRSLEENLGVKLLSRSPREVQLTDIGTKYYNDLVPAFEILKSATTNVRSSTADTPLRVSVPPVFAANWLMPRLTSFESKHPSIELLIDTQSQTVTGGYSSASTVDVSIKIVHERDICRNDLELVEISLFPVCSPCLHNGRDHAENFNIILKDHKLLAVDSYPNLWDPIINNLIDTPSADFSYVVYDDFFVMYESVMSGVGIAVGVDLLVDNYLKQNRITRFSSVTASSGLKLIVSQDTPASKSASLFLSWISDEIKEWAASRPNL